MPRKIGYGTFTPARKAALKKAQLASARARRKHGSEERHTRKVSKKKLGLAAAGAAAAAVGVYAYSKHQEKQLNKSLSEYEAMIKKNKESLDNKASESESAGQEIARMAAALRTEREKKWRAQGFSSEEEWRLHLEEASGDVLRRPENDEQWQARLDLYGEDRVLGEYAPTFGGRPEIHVGLPVDEVLAVLMDEAGNPTNRAEDEHPELDYVTLYHRTGGSHGKEDDGEPIKQKILQDQRVKVLERDEKAVGHVMPRPYTWWSNRLNDSNTRNAFGEHVVQVKLPKKFFVNKMVEQASQGALSDNGEVWVAAPADLLNAALAHGEIKIEDVPQEEITPKVEPKWRAPR